MSLLGNKIKRTELENWLITILIFLLTFQNYEPDYGVGLDPSYVWGLNWLFANDYSTLRNFLYPLGPLIVLKMPTTEGFNFLLYLLSFSILKIFFIYLLLKLSECYQSKKIFAICLILPTSYLVNIDLIIIGLCIVLSLLYLKHNNFLWGGNLCFFRVYRSLHKIIYRNMFFICCFCLMGLSSHL